MILADKKQTNNCTENSITKQKKKKKNPRCHKSIYIYIKNYMLYHGFSQDSVWQSLNGFLYLLMSLLFFIFIQYIQLPGSFNCDC